MCLGATDWHTPGRKATGSLRKHSLALRIDLPSGGEDLSGKGNPRDLEDNRKARMADLEAVFHNLHPCEVPEFLVISPDSGGDGDLEWLGR